MRCSRALAALLLAPLVACGPLPRPFKPDQVPGVADKQAVNPLLNPHVGESIAVALDGPAPPDAVARAEALAKSLSARGIPATARSVANPRYRLVGTPELVELPPDEPSDGAPTAIVWQLVDEAGRPRGPATRQPPAATEAVAAGIEAALDSEAAASAATAGPTPVRRAIALAQVSGAPGDGATAMPRALAAILPQIGIPYEADPAAAVLRVELRVAVAPRDDKSEQVKLDWTMRDPAGETVATLAQSNAVPKGRLAGRWGALAYDIAVAASDGLAAALDQAGKAVPQGGHRLETPPDILSLKPSLRRLSEDAQNAAPKP
ncbi:MAG: hypothetical protein AB7G39_11260 [Alphaproteobacteria bacterium]